MEMRLDFGLRKDLVPIKSAWEVGWLNQALFAFLWRTTISKTQQMNSPGVEVGNSTANRRRGRIAGTTKGRQIVVSSNNRKVKCLCINIVFVLNYSRKMWVWSESQVFDFMRISKSWLDFPLSRWIWNPWADASVPAAGRVPVFRNLSSASPNSLKTSPTLRCPLPAHVTLRAALAEI